MKRLSIFTLACVLLAPAADARPTVLELFTSQGCASCPEAETLVRQLSKDPQLLALSFHVRYFDQLGWKDPFATEANTTRQRTYASVLKLDNVFTPQMIVDGENSIIGSDIDAVEAAVTAAENNSVDIPVSIIPQADGNLRIAIGGNNPKDQVPVGAIAWEIHFNRGGSTSVEAGENMGQILLSTNNVMRFVPMKLVAGIRNDYLLSGNFPEDGVAIVLQKYPVGRIIGAAAFMRQGMVMPEQQKAEAR